MKPIIPALLIGLAMVAAACGSETDGAERSDEVTTTTTRSTTPVEPEPTTAPPTSAPLTTAPTAGEVVGANEQVTAEIQRVAGTDEDGPFYMVNLLDFHDDLADYPEGSEWSGSTGLEANGRYSEVVVPALASIGASPVFVAEVERSLIPGEVEWDQIGIVRYPSRAALLEMSSQPEFVAATVHKDASLANTFAMVSDRLPLPTAPPVDQATLPLPATDDDPGFMMVHVIDFLDEAQYPPGEEPDDAPIPGTEAVARYSANAGIAAVPLGIRPSAWFDVRGAVLGEHQRWEQVRLNQFPSFAAFDALTSDPVWASGQYHRTAGIAETYALMTRPILFDPTFADPDQRG